MTLARWESKSGKWYATVERLREGAYTYTGDGTGGVFYVDDDDAAIAHVQELVDKGLFQPDANKTPMRCVMTA